MIKLSLADKLKELFIPKEVPIYKVKLLAGLFSVALFHTIGFEIYHSIKEKSENKRELWSEEISKLEREYDFVQDYFDKVSLEKEKALKNSKSKIPAHLQYKFEFVFNKKMELNDKLNFMHDLSDTLSDKNLSYEKALKIYEDQYLE